MDAGYRRLRKKLAYRIKSGYVVSQPLGSSQAGMAGYLPTTVRSVSGDHFSRGETLAASRCVSGQSSAIDVRFGFKITEWQLIRRPQVLQ